MSQYEKIIITTDEKTVVLTGAGVSAESGIRTFRETGGLWETYPVEDVATPEGFERDPGLVWEFYNRRRDDLKKVEPNPAHMALAGMEKLFGDNLVLVTQNVDDLHERAAEKQGEKSRVIHMHGELNCVRCLECETVYEDKSVLPARPLCRECEGRLRPHVVWFGEVPFFMDEIHRALGECRWFIAVGTSGMVYPAAQFMQIAKLSGATTICVNPDASAGNSHTDHLICEKAGVAMPEILGRITGA